MLLIKLCQMIALYRLLDVLWRELMSVGADRLEDAVKAAGLSLSYFSPSFGSKIADSLTAKNAVTIYSQIYNGIQC